MEQSIELKDKKNSSMMLGILLKEGYWVKISPCTNKNKEEYILTYGRQ